MPDRHPAWINPRANLPGTEGNGLAVVSFVVRELQRAGNPPEVVNAYREEATSRDYSHLVRVSRSYAGMAPR